MPITTVFDSAKYTETAQAILEEYLRDTFPKDSFLITFDRPVVQGTKPIIFLQLSDMKPILIEHIMYQGSARLADVYVAMYDVLVITTDKSGKDAKAVQTGDNFVRCINSGKRTLADAGLEKADCSPFSVLSVATDAPMWWKQALLKFELTVVRGVT